MYFRSTAAVPNGDAHPRAAGAPSWAEHELCRLFRRAPDIRYQGHVHEVVEHSIHAAGLRLERADCRILHFGQLANDEIQQKKALFYRLPAGSAFLTPLLRPPLLFPPVSVLP